MATANLATPSHNAQIWWSCADLEQASGLRARFLRETDSTAYQHHVNPAQNRSLSARALLRALLSQRWGSWWAMAPLAHDQNGAPLLPDWPACEVTLSHSGHQVAVAASTATAVGIDIEWIDPALEIGPLVRYFFHPRESQAIARMAPHLQRPTFFAWWTAKEAVVKCLHQGLRLPANSFLVPNPLGSGPALGLETPIWVTALPAPTGYRAALAWRGKATTLGEVQCTGAVAEKVDGMRDRRKDSRERRHGTS